MVTSRLFGFAATVFLALASHGVDRAATRAQQGVQQALAEQRAAAELERWNAWLAREATHHHPVGDFVRPASLRVD